MNIRGQVRAWLVSAASVVLAAACSSVPDGVLDKEDMASLMADIHTAESMMELDRVSYRNDSGPHGS